MISIKRTLDTLFLIKIFFPLFAWFRLGWKPYKIAENKDLGVSISEGIDKNCLHLYGPYLYFRIRSKKLMKELIPGTNRIVIHSGMTWRQVFKSAII